MEVVADSAEIGHLSALNRPLVRANSATPEKGFGEWRRVALV